MNNLLFLALLLIISIVICYYFYETEKETFREIDGAQLWLDRCETYNKMKEKMNSPSCGIDDRCDHIKIGVKDEIILDKSGNIKIEERPNNSCDPVHETVIDLENKPKDLLTQDNFKIENMENMNDAETSMEAKIKYCKDPTRTCEDLGEHCGYCDAPDPVTKMGSFKFTNRGSKGSGYKDTLGNISTDDGPSCEGENWIYNDVEKCKRKMGQRSCSQIKSCDDFEKYPQLDGICGFCPTSGKAVPVEVDGEKNIPKYIPEDTCVGGEALEKHITLNARQCTPFMKDNPCVRPQYWSGIPDHSGDCYKKIYKQATGKDSKKNAEWWENDSNRRDFNMARDQLSADITLPSGSKAPGGYAPVPWLLKYFKDYAADISDKCYTKANKSWNWLTGLEYEPCVHQDDTGYPNRKCQRNKEGKTSDMLQTGTVSDYQNLYNISHCEGFTNKEGFEDFEDWLNENKPEILRSREANVWYQEMKAQAPDKFDNGAHTYNQYLKNIQNVMYSGKTYEKRLKATHLFRGLDYKPKDPPLIKPGDYVELIAKEHIYRGVLYRLKDFDGVKKALVMWDFYYNTKTGNKKNRGPTMGICLKENNNELHKEGDCIEGITAKLKNDSGVCENKNGDKKTSCLVPTQYDIMSRGEQRYTFGWPQYPSIKASKPDNPFQDKGWIDVGYLTVLRVCKSSSEGCSSTDYNCETSLETVNEYYKKPQDCDYDLSEYSECSAKCGGGSQYRNFKINLPAKGDGEKCKYGNNERGYTERVEWRDCNTQSCSPDGERQVRLRWCGKGGENDEDCVGINRYGAKNGVCYSMSPIDGITHEGRKGDFMNISKCRDSGGVWDAGNKLLKDGAHFYLEPVNPNSQNNTENNIYKFKWRPDNDGGMNFSRDIGLRDDYRDMCLHPNVNSIEIGSNEGVKWGRGDRSRFGPTNARNDNNPGEKTCPWKPNSNFGEMYDKWRTLGNVTHVTRDSDKNYIAFIAEYKYGKMCKFNKNGSYISGSGRYVNGLSPPSSPSDLLNMYNRGTINGNGFKFRRKSGFVCNATSGVSGNEWNGLGRIGSCNSPYANIAIERMEKGDKFRLKREAFAGSMKEGWCNSPRESRKAQIPGKGYYMGVKLNAWDYGAASSEWDRFYKSEKESVHKFDCDMNPDTAEKRVGLFKCYGGSQNGKKYPFLTNNAFCDDIDPLRKSGFMDNQLICKEDCETNGGTCKSEDSEWKGYPYHQIKTSYPNTLVKGDSISWRWSNSRIILGGQGYLTNWAVDVESVGTANRNKGYPTWRNKARIVPNIETTALEISYQGGEQGWGNPTAGPRLVAWSGNRVIYDNYVGGNSRSRGGGKGIIRAGSQNSDNKFNKQVIPHTEFVNGKPETITKIILVLREQGSGHKARVKDAKIVFNPMNSFT